MKTLGNQTIVVSLFVFFCLPVLFCSAAATVTFSGGTSAGWDFHELDGDIARNNTVDWSDLNVLAQHWLNSSCADANQWCSGADINASTGVDFLDYAILANNWGKIAGQSVLLQTIYGSAQDSSGNITANTARALQTDKGMAMAFERQVVLDGARVVQVDLVAARSCHGDRRGRKAEIEGLDLYPAGDLGGRGCGLRIRCRRVARVR